MKLNIVTPIFIFISAYLPASINILILAFDWETKTLGYPILVYSFLGISFMAVIVTLWVIRNVRSSQHDVKVGSASLWTGGLLNYSTPYLPLILERGVPIPQLLLLFGVFLFIRYVLVMNTLNLFTNPILAILGYNIYTVKYNIDGQETQSPWLVKGQKLQKRESCKVVKFKGDLFLVTDSPPRL